MCTIRRTARAGAVQHTSHRHGMGRRPHVRMHVLARSLASWQLDGHDGPSSARSNGPKSYSGLRSGRLRTTTKIFGPLNEGIESSRLITSARGSVAELGARRTFVELRGLSTAFPSLRVGALSLAAPAKSAAPSLHRRIVQLARCAECAKQLGTRTFRSGFRGSAVVRGIGPDSDAATARPDRRPHPQR
jgi:hypothetical protein